MKFRLEKRGGEDDFGKSGGIRYLPQNQTEKLLCTIHEYCELLGFLNTKHPEVLKEWKWSNGVTNATTQNQTNQTEGKELWLV